jgi:hypothetical protein
MVSLAVHESNQNQEQATIWGELNLVGEATWSISAKLRYHF